MDHMIWFILYGACEPYNIIRLICMISYDSYRMKHLEMKRSSSEMGVEYNLNFNYSNHFKTIHIHYRYKKDICCISHNEASRLPLSY